MEKQYKAFNFFSRKLYESAELISIVSKQINEILIPH
jgi:hypothetical protein